MPKKRMTLTVYVPQEAEEDFNDLKKLEPHGVSASKLVVACVRASIDTLKKEVPNKRTFMLNKVKVRV